MSPRVLYMGYGEIGRFCLDELLRHGFGIAGVFCRANDRTETDAGPSVYTFARRSGLHCFSATDPGDPAFLDEARSLEPDLLLSVQYDRILKPPLLAIPRHGSYNLHFGPLPRLRGCFPTKWAILEDEPGGVAFHCIDPGIDTGDVIARTLVPLAPDETDETLYGKLVEAGKALFVEQIGWMRALAPPPALPQDPSAASYHPKRIPYDGVVDWSRDASWVERFVRAFTFPPYPAAKAVLRGEEVQLRAPVSVGPDLPGKTPGEVVFREDGAAAVACGRGSLVFRSFLKEGRERPASDLKP
ncbi:MAG TPA: methionyl-tRNA formyltransferase [Thermoanaerobaculia bacterium]